MKNIASVSENGLVLFVDDTRKGGTTKGTQDDCLRYAFLYNSGECFAFLGGVDIAPNQVVDTSNINPNRNYVRGANNIVYEGVDSFIIGNENRLGLSAQNSTVTGRNAYSENYGELVYSAQVNPNRSRFVELGFAGITTDDVQTELFIGGMKDARFHLNTEYATAWFVEWNAVGINAESGEMWSKTNYQAYRYISGTFAEVGNHTGTILRDSNLDYDFDFLPITLTDGRSYLKVLAEGEANHNVYWNSTIKITEVRLPEILAANSILNPDFLGSPNWAKINQNATNVITIPNDATLGGCKMVGDGTRNLAARYYTVTWGTNKWKITFDLESAVGNTPVVQIRANNQNSQVFTTAGTHSYYIDTTNGYNFIQIMINSTTGAGSCIINNIKAQIVTF